MHIPPVITPAGENPTRIWGMDNSERLRRLAVSRGLPFGVPAKQDDPALVVDLAFIFDPTWIAYLAGRPGEVLTLEGRPVIAHVRNADERAAVVAAIQSKAPLGFGSGLVTLAYEDGATIVNETLRKRERPFAMPLTSETVRAAERASYFGAYKGVTDLLTKYLWPEWALVLTRIAARTGMSPNMVTGIGALCCLLATLAFWQGQYWLGMAVGLVFMVLDTVDGKLARCTITSSKWGNVFDHGLDLIHPPFWWYAWGVGLSAWGHALQPACFDLVMAAIIGGYVVQRIIEGAFMRLFGMHIHVWRKADSDFRLITARRNPNMVILFFSVVAQRPDIGLVAVAWWTVLSCLFHLVRLVQALIERGRKKEILSWLA